MFEMRELKRERRGGEGIYLKIEKNTSRKLSQRVPSAREDKMKGIARIGKIGTKGGGKKRLGGESKCRLARERERE